MNQDNLPAKQIRETVEASGDAVANPHLRRLGPGRLSAIVCVAPVAPRDASFYRSKLARFPAFSLFSSHG
jgi:hypothetical protein